MSEHTHAEYMYWDQMQSNADDAMKQQLAGNLGAKLVKDGNQWCWLIGDDLQSGVAGYGDSPRDALDDLWMHFHAPLPTPRA